MKDNKMKDHLENRIKEIVVGLDYEKSLLGSLEKQVADTAKKIAGLSIDLAVYNNALATEEVNQKVGWHHANAAHPAVKDNWNDKREPVDPLTEEFAKMLTQDPKLAESVMDSSFVPKPLHFVVKDISSDEDELAKLSKKLSKLNRKAGGRPVVKTSKASTSKKKK